MTTFQTVRKLVQALWQRYPARCVVLFLVGLLRAGTEGLAMVLFIPVVQHIGIGSAGGGTLNRIFARLGVASSLEAALGCVILTAAASAAIGFYHETLQKKVLRFFIADLQIQAYRVTVAASQEHLARQRLGEIVLLFSRATNQAGSAVTMIFRTTTALLMTAALLVVAISQSLASVLVLLLMTVLFTPFIIWNHRRVAASLKKVLEVWRKTVGDLADQLRHVGVIKAMGIERESIGLISRQVTEVAAVLARLGVEAATLRLVFEPVSLILSMAFFYVALMWLKVPVENLVVLMLVMFRLLPKISGILESNNRMPETVGGYAEMLQMMAEMTASTTDTGREDPPAHLTRPIRLEEVTVVLGGRRVLDGCSLEIPERGSTAIIGPSGAGKSTVINVLLGLQPCAAGRVLVEGRDLTNLALSKFRRRIGYVSQDTPLFNTTLRENLLVAAPDRDEQAIRAALSQAGLDPLLQKLPRGLDTPVGEQGSNFSGGERQRITLARALIRDPLLLVLDEPTSALDPDTTAFLCERIATLSRTLPVLVITHDPSLMAIADRIYEIRVGKAAPVDRVDDGAMFAGGAATRIGMVG